MYQYYPGDSHTQEIGKKQCLDLIQKAKAVKQAAQKNKIVKSDCLDQVDRPLRDLSCEVGGYAGPVYLDVTLSTREPKQIKIWFGQCAVQQ